MTWYASNNPNGFVTGKRFSIDLPCVTVMADGMGGDSCGHWEIHYGPDMKSRLRPNAEKPPYRVPSMEQIRAIPWNGYRAASTFAGGGGSSTGYRMAGFKVVWANEIVPVARDSYAANMDSATILDGRDIRQIEPAEILAATRLRPGELDLFDGSPPCVSFSTAGKRERNWGKVTQSHDIRQRHDDLFFEYARLLRGLQPKVFVAENVSGLVKGTAKGYFLEILATLKACGYCVEARLLDAQWLGVPQARQRLIFVGVRNDLALSPAFPAPMPYRYSIRDALPELQSGHMLLGNPAYTNKPGNSFPRGMVLSFDNPCHTVQAERHMIGSAEYFLEEPALHQVRVLTNKSYREAWQSDDLPSPTILAGGPGKSGCVEESLRLPPCRARGYDGEETAFCFTIAAPGKPMPTVTTKHLDFGHPVERRKFSIREVRRICSFPDDYVLAGSYADQWARCGNAVPPVMMFHIASVIREQILDRISAG